MKALHLKKRRANLFMRNSNIDGMLGPNEYLFYEDDIQAIVIKYN